MSAASETASAASRTARSPWALPSLWRSSLAVYLLSALCIAPFAQAMAGFMERLSPQDLRDGRVLADRLADLTFSSVLFGTAALAWLAAALVGLPLRMAWLSSLDDPDEQRPLAAHALIGLKRCPRALGVSVLVSSVALVPLLAAASLPYAAAEMLADDPDARFRAMMTALSALPLAAFGLATLAAVDLGHAAALTQSVLPSTLAALRRAGKAIPAYGVYLLVTLGLTLLGYAISAPPWALLILLQPLVFARFCVRGAWLFNCLKRVTIHG